MQSISMGIQGSSHIVAPILHHSRIPSPTSACVPSLLASTSGPPPLASTSVSSPLETAGMPPTQANPTGGIFNVAGNTLSQGMLMSFMVKLPITFSQKRKLNIVESVGGVTRILTLYSGINVRMKGG